MNENKELICPKCGTKNNSNSSFCTNCGYNFINQNNSVQNTNIPNTNNSVPIQNNNKKKNNDLKGIVWLIFSIFNIIVVFPFVAQFSLLFMLFAPLGGNTSSTTYYGLLLVASGYALASIVALIAFIVNVFLKGKVLIFSILSIIISFFIGIAGVFLLYNSNFSISKIGIKNNTIEKNKIIYEDEYYLIKQIDVEYNKRSMDVIISIENLSGQDLAITEYVNATVNRYTMSAFLNKDEGNNYRLSIDYSKLKQFNIDSVESIEVNLNLPTQGEAGSKKILISIVTNSSGKSNNSSDNKEVVIYTNEYFKIYYYPVFKGYVDIYYESLVPDSYTLFIENEDIGTPGNARDFFDASFSNYSISKEAFYYHCSYDNFSYYKADYKIYSGGKMIKEDKIDVQLDGPIIKKSC